ncbi:MAG: FecR domain-containing protein [Reyranella sp.]|uniref:FecR family protein n=1 Tax=Reyranella sp. TaxID=1929291 RepID=UPI001AC30F83|nr:FecR domain-containing protein [Reyranella sp.]MBN9090436.1 FecR domain-containing protein [Reyranella sp.]
MSRTCLISLVACVAMASPAAANVGVTSVTSGDPLGQPPAQAERILRVGTDIQANELVTTKDDDRAHIVFLDGTALTVGPNSSLVIDRFVYDPNHSNGVLSVNMRRGVMRLVGGALTKTGDVRITTPSGSLGIRGGIVVVEVSDTGATQGTFLFGHALTVTGGGKTVVATRPGSLIQMEPGRVPSPPTILPVRGLGSTALLEKPHGQAGVGSGAPASSGANLRSTIEGAFDRSQFSAGNSKVPPQTHDQKTAYQAQQGHPTGHAPQILALTRLSKVASEPISKHNTSSGRPRTPSHH